MRDLYLTAFLAFVLNYPTNSAIEDLVVELEANGEGTDVMFPR